MEVTVVKQVVARDLDGVRKEGMYRRMGNSEMGR
jgi:hypothetical protein